MSIAAENAKLWNRPEKLEAREFSIIRAYRESTGEYCLPPDRQYYGLSGQLYDANGLLPSSEFMQFIKAKLFTPKQYNGIELNLDICEGNRKAIPEAKFYYGEIGQVLNNLALNNNFKPGIINLDTMVEPEKALKLLGRVMDIVNYVDGPVIIACNMQTYNNQYNRKYEWDDVASIFNENIFCKTAFNFGWEDIGRSISYSTKKGGRMGTIVLLRKEPALCLPWV